MAVYSKNIKGWFTHLVIDFHTWGLGGEVMFPSKPLPHILVSITLGPLHAEMEKTLKGKVFRRNQ